MASLFFLFFLSLLNPQLSFAEIVEAEGEERELEELLENFKSQQQAISGQIEAQVKGGGTLDPAAMMKLMEQMKNNPEQSSELAEGFLGQLQQKKNGKPGELSAQDAQKSVSRLFSMYQNYPHAELTKQFAETMQLTGFGRPMYRFFPWLPAFLASWVQDKSAPYELIRLTSMRDWLIVYAAINLMIVIANWVWKRRIRNLNLGFGVSLKRFSIVWTLRLIVFYVMIWPYVGPSLKMLFQHASKHHMALESREMKTAPVHIQSAYQVV